MAALTTVATATKEQARHQGIYRQLGVKTPVLLEPYYGVCVCACSGKTVFIVCVLKRTDILSTIIKLASNAQHRQGSTNTETRKDGAIRICNVRAAIEGTRETQSKANEQRNPRTHHFLASLDQTHQPHL